MKYVIALLLFVPLLSFAAPSTTTKIAWTASTLNTDGTALTDLKAYRVYQNGAKVAEVSATTLSYSITNLAPGTYTFAVTAVNAAGKESDKATAPVFAVARQPMPPSKAVVTLTVTVP